jgi:tRNA1(Val) A37 N6-methylase TrmN6
VASGIIIQMHQTTFEKKPICQVLTESDYKNEMMLLKKEKRVKSVNC